MDKKRNEFLEGTEWKAILVFSVPIILGNLLQQLYNTIDGIVVGRLINSDALAAIGNCSTVIALFLAVALGFGAGCGILVSQYYGGRSDRDLRETFATGLCMMIGMGLVLSAAGLVFAGTIYGSLMNIRDERIFGYAVSYFDIYCLGLVFTYGYNYISAVLRAVGDSRATLYFLAVTSVLNLVLDLVMVRSMGIEGAAWATVISQVACFIFSTAYMLKKYEIFSIRPGSFHISAGKAGKCVHMGVPAILQQCSVSLGQGVMQRLVNGFGGSVMAAYTVGSKIERYATIPIIGLQVGISTFTGQNMGAGKTERARSGLRQSELMMLAVIAVIGIPINLFAPQLAGLFGLTGEGSAVVVEFVRFMVPWCIVIFGAYQAVSGVLQGSGDVGYTTFISLSSLTARAVYAYIKVYCFGAGYSIIWRSQIIAYVWSLGFAVYRYLRGTWKEKAAEIMGTSEQG